MPHDAKWKERVPPEIVPFGYLQIPNFLLDFAYSLDLGERSSTALLLLLYLIRLDYRDEKFNMRSLSHKTGISHDALAEAKAKLVNKGLITVYGSSVDLNGFWNRLKTHAQGLLSDSKLAEISSKTSSLQAYEEYALSGEEVRVTRMKNTVQAENLLLSKKRIEKNGGISPPLPPSSLQAQKAATALKNDSATPPGQVAFDKDNDQGMRIQDVAKMLVKTLNKPKPQTVSDEPPDRDENGLPVEASKREVALQAQISKCEDLEESHEVVCEPNADSMPF